MKNILRWTFGSVKIFLIDEKYFHASDLCIVLLLQESCMYAEFRVLAVFLKLQESCSVEFKVN